MNNSGPKMDPWGTPDVTVIQSEEQLSIMTHCSVTTGYYVYIILHPSHFNAWAGEHLWDIALPRPHVVSKHFSSGI